MNNWMGLVGSVAAQLIVAAYVYGKLTGAVSGHGDTLRGLRHEQDDQWEKINDNREAIAKVKGRLRINGAND